MRFAPRFGSVATASAVAVLFTSGFASAKDPDPAGAFWPRHVSAAPGDEFKPQLSGTLAYDIRQPFVRGELADRAVVDADVIGAGGVTRWRSTETWFGSGGGAVSRLRVSTGGLVRKANGAPLLVGGPDEGVAADAQHLDVTYTRGWPAAVRFDTGRYQLDVTPHAGVGWGPGGGSAEAGATLRLGPNMGDNLSKLAGGGRERFGDRGRWYLFAAARGRALGYNFQNTEDGWKHMGVTSDAGAFIGDEQAGIAWRKGDLQASFGYTHRKLKLKGMDVIDLPEGSAHQSIIGFQLSIKPSR